MGPRWMTITAILLAAAIILSWQGLANADAGQPTRAVVWASVGLTAYAASLLTLIGGGQGSWLGLSRWRLGSWILLWYGVAFGLASLTWVQQQTGPPTQISSSSVLRALWLVAVGMTLWVIGYSIGPGRPAKRFGIRAMGALSSKFTPEMRSPLAPWILYGIGMAAGVATALTTGHFGYIGDAQSALTAASGYQQWLSLLGLCAPLAVSAAALQAYRERVDGARVTLTVLFLAEIVLGAVAGNKETFIIAVLAVAVPFTASRRRVHKGLLTFAVLAFLLIIVPFNQTYRNTARSTTGTLLASQAVDAVPGILRQTVVTENVGGTLGLLGQFYDGADQGDRQPRDHHAAHAVPAWLPESGPARGRARRHPHPSGAVAGQAHPRQRIRVRPGVLRPAVHAGFRQGDNAAGRPVPVRRLDAGDRGDVSPRLRGALPRSGYGRVRQSACHFSFRATFPQPGEPGRQLGGNAGRPPRDVAGLAPRRSSHIPEKKAGHSSMTGGGDVVMARGALGLALVVDHPAQHFVRGFQLLAAEPGLRVHVCYGTTPERSYDVGFARPVSWDIDLLAGYSWAAPGSDQTAAWLRRELRRAEPDVVVCYGWATPVARAAILYCLLARIPLLMYGDTTWQHSASGGHSMARSAALNLLLRRCAGAVSTGTFNREFYIQHGMDPGRIWPGVCPAETDTFGEARAERQPSTDGELRIGFAGKLIARKGVNELLRAAAQLPPTRAWSVTVVGDGPLLPEAHALAAELGLGDRVVFRGFANTTEMPKLLAGFDVVVVPSRRGHAGPRHDRGDGSGRGNDRQRCYRGVGSR